MSKDLLNAAAAFLAAALPGRLPILSLVMGLSMLISFSRWFAPAV